MISFDTTRIWGIAGNNDIFFSSEGIELWSKTPEMFFQIEAALHRAALQVSDCHERWRHFGLLAT